MKAFVTVFMVLSAILWLFNTFLAGVMLSKGNWIVFFMNTAAGVACFVSFACLKSLRNTIE